MEIILKNTTEGVDIQGYFIYENETLPEIREKLSLLKERELFKGSKGSFYKEVPLLEKSTFYLGLGDKEKDEATRLETLRILAGKALKEAVSLKKKELSLFLPTDLMIPQYIEAITEGLVLGSYSFDTYLSEKKSFTVEKVCLTGEGITSLQEALEEGILLGEMTNLSRELGNEPASVVTPAYLGEKATSLGKEMGFTTLVYGKKDIESLSMNAFLAVANGSAEEPQLIVMEYDGRKGKEGLHLGLVGKGITFDTGGLSLKPAASMLTMQGDMCGAASVIAAIGAISKQKLPIKVTGVVAACDNAVSAKSYRPNDILTSRSGKTIFIGNTDAEGRLTLIDAIDYILTEKKVDKVVDIATLTGAAEVALGQKIAAVITNNDDFLTDLKEAAQISGERIWELPHDEDFLELIESPYADLSNTGGRFAGTITAGLFLGSVVGETPWLHIDIAGPSWTEKNKGYFSKGATGYGTRLLYQLARVANR